MLEYKLVPIGDMNHTTIEDNALHDKGEKPQNEEISKSEKNPISGGSDIKNYVFKILMDNTIKKNLKMKLLKGVIQKHDSNQEDELKSSTLEPQREDNLFEIIKLNLNISHISEAYKFYLYLKKRSDITWDNQGVLIINGNKTHLDLFNFFKFLFASRTQIKDVKDKKIIKRILYQASDMNQLVKNKYIKDILVSEPIDNKVSSDSEDDNDNIFTDAKSTISLQPPYKMSLRSNQRGYGLQKFWETW